MSKPMTPDQTRAALKAGGVVFKEYPDWWKRCRCCADSGPHNPNGPFIRAWGDVNGNVQHITGGDLGNRTVEQYIRDIILNDPNLLTKSGFVTDPDGIVWLVATGRCNHAGGVGSNVRDHMRAADFSLTDDYDDRWRGASADGNAFTYGNEAIAAVTMNAKQRAASVRLWAAIAHFHGWTGQETAGHGEISAARGPADPHLHMGTFRKDIMARVRVLAGTAPAPVPDPTPTPTPDPTPNPTPVTSITVPEAYMNRADYDKKHGMASKNARDSRVAKVCLASKPLWIHLVECSASQVDDMDALFVGYTRVVTHNSKGEVQPGKGRESWYQNDQGVSIIAAERDNVDHMLNGDDKPYLKIVWEIKGIRSVTGVFHNENEGTTVQHPQLWDVMDSVRDFGKAHGAVLQNTAAVGDSNYKGASASLWDSGNWKNGMLHADSEIHSDLHTTNNWTGPTTPGRPIDVWAVRRGAHVLKGENVLLGGDDVSDHSALRIERVLVSA